MAGGAPQTAVELLRRAEREPPTEATRPGLLLELGTAASRAGRGDGVQLLRDAFAVADEQPGRAVAGLELAFALGFSSSQSAEAIPVLERFRETRCRSIVLPRYRSHERVPRPDYQP